MDEPKLKRGYYLLNGEIVKLSDVCKDQTEINRIQARMSRYGMTLEEALKRRIHENKGQATVKHGKADSPEYRTWTAIKRRCFNKNTADYEDYGGRGITVSNEWINDFQAFYDHIGPKPSDKYSIDRIDNNGNYEPGNVRWATASEQMKNQRKRKPFRLNYERKGQFEYEGQIYTLRQLAEKFNIEKWVVKKRLYDLGWDLQRALTEPYDPTKRPYEYQGKMYSLQELSDHTGVSSVVLGARISREKMSVEEAVNKPVRKSPSKKSK